MESNRPLKLLARLSRPWAVKKLMALSSAELTRLPVASRVCVCVTKSEVCCKFSRFDRTPADRTMSDILRTFLVYLPYWQLHMCDPVDREIHRISPQTARKSSWLMTGRSKMIGGGHKRLQTRGAARCAQPRCDG